MDDMKDRCVTCGIETPYDEYMDINFRSHYVVGAGQLCSSCYNGMMVKVKTLTDKDSPDGKG